ncbi:hypothetical protein FDP41_012664 [Naegleria fowleri]|uniref:EF-1-gamma C-terminal domain-containing protein n=1 Tax=Naegleria fowleri TaxID=5763 RepID=A0A6A5BZM3_NAEFO|nr:uncharacterized protein FDP41_012664 [Naegleria fowleri]KAF0980876.1 hypothetical protein FDP41_012664 [Naegleria fowleri]CAG4710742.1 unnamed protein product [Naegleria fowleri]
MDINEFKRKYSNESDTKAVCDWMFEKISAAPEAWSFWQADYKYNDELSGPAWMQANLVEGYFRNLEALHKNCFASALVLAKDSAQRISMIWLVPTQNYPAEFNSPEIAGSKICEGFDLVKLDPTNETDKQKIIDYFVWNETPGTFDGYSYASGKIFK